MSDQTLKQRKDAFRDNWSRHIGLLDVEFARQLDGLLREIFDEIEGRIDKQANPYTVLREVRMELGCARVEI